MSTRSVSRNISRNFGAPSAKSSVAVLRCDSSQAVSSSIATAADDVASASSPFSFSSASCAKNAGISLRKNVA